MVLHYVLCGIRFSMTVRTSENFNSVMNNMHVIITFTINNMRSFIIFANFEHFARVKNFINDRKYRKDHAGSGEIRQKTYEHAVKVTMFFVGNVIFQALSFLISGMANTEPFLIPMELGCLPYFAKEAVGFCYSMLFLTAPFFAASNFLSLYLAIIGLRAELRIALDSIGSIPDRVNQLDYANDAIEKFDQGDEFWNVLHSEMKYSIEHHVEVLDHLNIFKNVTNYSFLLLYYMTMLQIAAGVLIVIFNPVVDLFYILSIDYSFRYTLECFVFCYMVSSLNEIVSISCTYQHILTKLLSQTATYHWRYHLASTVDIPNEVQQAIRQTLPVGSSQPTHRINGITTPAGDQLWRNVRIYNGKVYAHH
nr:uncharacterized protein LOC109409196 [Aedes albopictus]